MPSRHVAPQHKAASDSHPHSPYAGTHEARQAGEVEGKALVVLALPTVPGTGAGGAGEGVLSAPLQG